MMAIQYDSFPINPQMTLEEVYDLKYKYESDINHLLDIFHNLTKLKIDDIILSDIEVTSISSNPNKKFLYTVELDIRL